MLTTKKLPKIEEIMQEAREAGARMRAYRDAAIHRKDGHCNFVTDADIAVEAYLEKTLTALLPGSRFFAEEKDNEPLGGEPTFVVDPIDGTLNYMRGRNASAVSIALLVDKQPVMGVIYNPYADEMFTAQAGQGAFLNGAKIRVSETPFERALVAFGTSPYDAELAKRTLRAAESFLLEAGDLRRGGAAALDLCDISCGRADVFFELRLRPWDVAAGSLLVEEAGGRFFSLGKEEPYYDGPCGILAASRSCEKEALRILQQVCGEDSSGKTSFFLDE